MSELLRSLFVADGYKSKSETDPYKFYKKKQKKEIKKSPLGTQNENKTNMVTIKRKQKIKNTDVSDDDKWEF